MKSVLKQSIILNAIVFALLFGQIWNCILPLGSNVLDSKMEQYDFGSAEDASEEEESKQEQEEKVLTFVLNSDFYLFHNTNVWKTAYNLALLHHLEIHTPPPKLFL